jgi:hypothetical protein
VSQTVLDQARLDRLFQYALAIAAQADDFGQKALGPIHLLKYAYLADLAHGERNDGATYSGTPWIFHHFGPWSADAFTRIGASLTSVGAQQLSFRSQYADDTVRFKLDVTDAESLARRLERELPREVVYAISRAVQQHGSDTADLLKHVYQTRPMLNAAPGAVLDFRPAASQGPAPAAVRTELAPKLSAKDKRLRKSVLQAAREEIQRRVRGGAVAHSVPSPAPRYDEVFFEGTAQLDRAAGAAIEPSTGELQFDGSVWLSSQRRDPAIS